MKNNKLTRNAIIALAATAIVAAIIPVQMPQSPSITPKAEKAEQDDFGDLQGIPPHIQAISDAMEAGHDVGLDNMILLSDYIEKEQEAWDNWASSL